MHITLSRTTCFRIRWIVLQIVVPATHYLLFNITSSDATPGLLKLMSKTCFKWSLKCRWMRRPVWVVSIMVSRIEVDTTAIFLVVTLFWCRRRCYLSRRVNVLCWSEWQKEYSCIVNYVFVWICTLSVWTWKCSSGKKSLHHFHYIVDLSLHCTAFPAPKLENSQMS
jgi:hypothetical protein